MKTTEENLKFLQLLVSLIKKYLAEELKAIDKTMIKNFTHLTRITFMNNHYTRKLLMDDF